MAKENKEKQLYLDFGEEFSPEKREKFVDVTERKLFHDLHDEYPYIPEHPIEDENENDTTAFDPATYSSEDENFNEEKFEEETLAMLDKQDKQTIDIKKDEFSLRNRLSEILDKKDEILFFKNFTKDIQINCYFDSLGRVNEQFAKYLNTFSVYISFTDRKDFYSEKRLHEISNGILMKDFFNFKIIPRTLKARRKLFWNKFRIFVLENKQKKKAYDPSKKLYHF